jgi:hypothetical protein
MSKIGAPVRALGKAEFSELFDAEQVEQAFEVDEIAFNFLELRNWGLEVLAQSRIELRLSSRVQSVEQLDSDLLSIELDSGERLSSKYFFNATYGGIEYITGLKEETRGVFAHQATEMILVTPPQSFSGKGVTIMDGPFFSVMPYPGESCYSLSHVRYTPRARSNGNPLAEDWYFNLDWQDDADVFDLMIRDASRYVPSMNQLTKIKSIREVKTLVNNAKNDSRPIFFQEHELAGCYSILGGKLDNVFDMFEFLDRLEFS